MNTAIDKNKYFIRFASCFPVKGAARSLVCDTQRKNYDFIPNDLYTILTKFPGKTIGTVFAAYPGNEVMLEQYFHFLLEKEYIFLTTIPPRHFPSVDLRHDAFPFLLQNAILDFDAHSSYNYRKALEELSVLGCEHVLLRFYDTPAISLLQDILMAVATAPFRSLELMVPYSAAILQQLPLIAAVNRRLRRVVLTAAPENSIPETSLPWHLLYTTASVTDETSCGQISPAFFRCHLPAISTSAQFNSCLYKKIGVDKNGLIKNCPSAAAAYGHINDTSITTVAALPAFRALQLINKSQVDTCRVCEFRLICHDCRVYTADNNPFGKPLKCNYDPYTTKWET